MADPSARWPMFDPERPVAPNPLTLRDIVRTCLICACIPEPDGVSLDEKVQGIADIVALSGPRPRGATASTASSTRSWRAGAATAAQEGDTTSDR